MSIVVLGNDPITYRRCEAEYLFDLQDWFAWVEMHAWARVNAYYDGDRPKEIFLVIGQHLSPSYAITHQKNGSFECEVLLEADVGIPSVVEGKGFGRLAIKNAYANFGFEQSAKKSSETDPINYTIFLHTYNCKSKPLQPFKRALKSRVLEQYR